MPNNLIFQALISTRAEKEIEDAWAWYEDRQVGLGDKFIKEVVGQIRQVELYPESFSARYKTFREASVPVFPYILIYRINKMHKLVYILSVFHAKRNPKKKYPKTQEF
jgi:plasmid stabilization system protein ParE